jgi:outer membrane protein assembly factor BamA
VAKQLHNGAGMRAISVWVLLILFISPPSLLGAVPQQTGINARGIVESAEISGINEDEISSDLRDAVHKLAGQPFDQRAADSLVARIQGEKPDFIASTRLLPGDQSDRVKVVFLLEKTNEGPDTDANVNSRYTVERVEVHGFDESRLSASIRNEMKELVGSKLDQQKADRIQHEMEDALRPRHSVSRRTEKGSDRQFIVVVYEIHPVRWIPFIDEPPKRVVYHSKQNFSVAFNANLFDKSNTRLYFGLADDQDPLLERFAGFNFGVESVKVGTDRLGIALRYSRYHDRWQPSTVAADRFGIYRERNTFDPTITFAFDPRLRLTAGLSLSELQMQYPAIHTNNANAVVASLNFDNTWGKSGSDRQSLQANYDFRAGNHELDSDFIYTRHYGRAEYVYGHEKNQLIAVVSAGTISGNAPLFERFSLGNVETLRGWNKFDIAPAGGNRMVHGTLQYRFGQPGGANIHIGDHRNSISDIHFGFHLFYDVGAVGNHGTPFSGKHSVGFGFGDKDVFMELGFPIRSDHVVPVFMMGIRL